MEVTANENSIENSTNDIESKRTCTNDICGPKLTCANDLEPKRTGLGKLFNSLINGANVISYAVLAIMSVPVVLDVLLRNIANKSVPGIIDIEEFMLVMIVFLALPFIQKKKEHIRIELLTSHFPCWLQAVLDSFIYLSSAVLFAIISWQLTMQIFVKHSLLSQSLKIPVSIFIAIAAVGMIVFVITLIGSFLESAAQAVRAGKWKYLIPAVAFGVVIAIFPLLFDLSSFHFSSIALGGLGMLVLITLMLLGMPIGFAMAMIGFIGMLITSKSITATFSMVGFAPYYSTASFVFAVIPLFILMGELALHSGISNDLFDTASKWLGRMPGGIAISGVAGCSGFAAVCGDSMATAVTMGSVTLPEMKKHNYDVSLATGSLAAGGTLGILIPPSIGFIFYALITEESIGKLFVAGIIPGLLLASLFIGCIYIIATRYPERAPRGESYSFKEKIMSLKGVLGMLALIVLVLGGILAGFFSPTEGGAVGAAGAFVIAIIRKRLTWENFKMACEETANITSKLFAILIGVGILGYFLAATRLPFELAELIASLPFNRYIIFGIVCVLYIILGCLMNVIPMILLTLPSLYPSILALGFDPIWFGVIMVILMEMGQISPPVGVNVYALSSVAKGVPMETIFKGILPFFLCMALCVIILLVFPQIALFLPNLLFK